MPGVTEGVNQSTYSNGVSPRAIVTYKLSEDAQFNLQAARGFRLGGLNDPINRPLCSDPNDFITFGQNPKWKDEKNWNYEIGAKVMKSLDRKSTRLNSSHTSISYASFSFKNKKH